MNALLAALPLLGALAWIVALRRSALGAGSLGIALSLAIAAVVPAFALDANGVGLAILRGVLVASVVGYVIYFGLLLFRLTERSGAQATLAEALAHLPGDRAARALILCIPVGAFFEAVSGFGLGIVVVAPLLIGIGYSRRSAALLALFTQNAVPWGSSAIGIVFSGTLSGLSIDEIGLGCALLVAPVFLYYAVLTLVVAEDRGAATRHGAMAVVVGGSMAAAAWLGTRYLGVEPAMVVGGPIVTLIGIAWARWTSPASSLTGMAVKEADEGRLSPVRGGQVGVGRSTTPTTPATKHAGIPTGIGRAVVPYIVLVAALLASRLVPPIRDALRGVGVVRVPIVDFELALLYSSGFALLIACVVAAAIGRLNGRAIAAQVARTSRHWVRAFAALAGFTIMAEIMLRSGMTRELATSVALAVGPGYALVAPALGGLSGFLTGSNVAGSAMLLPFQLVAADRISLSALVVTSAQNAAAAVFSMASPARVVLAAAVAGEPRAEPTLIRAALVFCAGSLVLMTIAELVWIAVRG